LGEANIVAKNPSFMVADSAQNAGGAKAKKSAESPAVGKDAKKPAKKPAADFNPFAVPGIKTDIPAIAGMHDIYFVFKNDQAKGDQVLMSVSKIKFNDEKTP
jgi:cytochrome c